MEFETTKSMAEIRPILDAALAEEFPGGLLQNHWEGEVLHLTGPGAEGTVRLEGERLVGEATLRPPASLMRPMIEQKMTDVLRKAAS